MWAFWDCHYRGLPWCTWYRVRLRVAQTLSSSPASLMALTLRHVRRLAGVIWFPFCSLHRDNIFSLCVTRSFASATYYPWLLWRKHDVTQNLKHARLFIDCTKCLNIVRSSGHPCWPRVSSKKKKYRHAKHSKNAVSGHFPSWVYDVKNGKSMLCGEKSTSFMGVFTRPHILTVITRSSYLPGT